jgi:hypothetical protein
MRTDTMTSTQQRPSLQRKSLWVCIASIVAGCNSEPPSPPPKTAQPEPQPTAPAPVPPEAAPAKVSHAGSPRDYRRDAAAHLYAHNSARIFPGKMPPLLYAIGVLQVDINARGAVTALRWMRAPSQAPEVVAEIERAVRQAAPFPAPVKLGHVTYTDTWLWDRSGRFQLDTLTEGQL